MLEGRRFPIEEFDEMAAHLERTAANFQNESGSGQVTRHKMLKNAALLREGIAWAQDAAELLALYDDATAKSIAY